MGILGGVSGQSRVVHLAAGDYVVLVSDGLLVDGPGWVMQQLELSAAKQNSPIFWRKSWWKPPAPERPAGPSRRHYRRCPPARKQLSCFLGGGRVYLSVSGTIIGETYMLTVTVAQDGSGDFASIAEAVLAVPYKEEALVQVGPGIYREKLVCEKRCITLRGAGADKTKLVWGDGGKLPHKDGRPTHTFRSYTAFFSGETLCVEDMTIENDAGPGAKAGQAVAAYVDSTRAVFRRVKLLGSQDTLFCAPLPEKEREKDAFSARAVLRPANRPPSTTPTVRSQAILISSSAAATPSSKTVSSARWITTSLTAMSQLLRAKPMDWALCSGTAISSPTAAGQRLSGPSVASRGQDGGAGLPSRRPHRAGRFIAWNDRTDTGLASFAEAGSTGPGAAERPAWVKQLSGPRRRNCWPAPAPSADRRPTEDVTNEKTAEFCKVAHHCRGAGRNGRDDGGCERPRLPGGDANAGQQSGHLSPDACHWKVNQKNETGLLSSSPVFA